MLYNRKPTKLEEVVTPVPFEAALKGLSRSQLIDIIQNIALINEDVKQVSFWLLIISHFT